MKELFDLGRRAYLDGAAQGPMPRRSLEAARRALEWKRDPAILEDRLYFELPDRVRAAASVLVGCEPEDIALATGASHGISLVACGLDWRRGDRVVLPQGEFPANALPWLALRSRGVQVEMVEPERVPEAIDAATRVVSVGHVNFASGRRLDLEAIGDACAAHDAVFVVDAAQSLGAVPFDARRCGATVVAVAGYKWLMSPYGTGFTYVRPDAVGLFRQSTFNWATIVGADDFNRLVELEPEFRPGAIRFDVPETAAFVQTAAIAESLELIVGTGVERIYRHASGLLDRVVAGLPAGFRVDSDLRTARRSTILRVLGPDAVATERVHERLMQAGVAVSLREGGLRVAPGMWASEDDVDRFLDVLDAGSPGR